MDSLKDTEERILKPLYRSKPWEGDKRELRHTGSSIMGCAIFVEIDSTYREQSDHKLMQVQAVLAELFREYLK